MYLNSFFIFRFINFFSFAFSFIEEEMFAKQFPDLSFNNLQKQNNAMLTDDECTHYKYIDGEIYSWNFCENIWEIHDKKYQNELFDLFDYDYSSDIFFNNQTKQKKIALVSEEQLMNKFSIWNDMWGELNNNENKNGENKSFSNK